MILVFQGSSCWVLLWILSSIYVPPQIQPFLFDQRWQLIDMFLQIFDIITCLFSQLYSLLHHIYQISQVLISSTYPLPLIFHSHNHYWIPFSIDPQKSILPISMDIFDNLFVPTNLIRLICFIPMDPFLPHLNCFLLAELLGNGESGDCC